MAPILALEKISKRFGAVVVANNVDFAIALRFERKCRTIRGAKIDIHEPVIALP